MRTLLSALLFTLCSQIVMRNWQLRMAPALPMDTCISMYRILHSILRFGQSILAEKKSVSDRCAP